MTQNDGDERVVKLEKSLAEIKIRLSSLERKAGPEGASYEQRYIRKFGVAKTGE